MSIDKQFYKTPILFLLGILFFLLSFSIFIEDQKIVESEDITQVNPFFNNLPLSYLDALMTDAKNKGDSTKNNFKLIFADSKNKRELIIIKESPEDFELFNDFSVHIYPKNKSKLGNNELYYSYYIVNKAVIFKHNNKKIASFKMELPFFDIEKIVIKQVLRNKKANFWTETVTLPFKKTNLYSNNQLDAVFEKSVPNIYTPLLLYLLDQNSIEYNKSLFSVNKGAYSQTSDFIDEKVKTKADIINSKLFWQSINIKNSNVLSYLEINGNEKEKIISLIKNYISGHIDFETLFNVKKLAALYAIQSVFTNECTEGKVSLIYNSKKNIIEPLFNSTSCIGESSKFIPRNPINNSIFINEHVRALDEISKLDFEEILKDMDYIFDQIKLINNYDHQQIFSYDYLRINQLKIKKSLKQTIIIKPELISIDNDKLVLSVLNVSYYPVEVIGLNYKIKKEITKLTPVRKIYSGQRDTIEMLLPRSFENLFVSKKSKKTGFLLHKHIYDLKVKSRTKGLDNINYETIIPYQEMEFVGEDLFRINSTLENRKDIIINEQSRSISFAKKEITISTPLIIPKGYTFIVHSGTKIDIVDGGKIISHAPLNFIGTKAKPIEIFSSDKKGQGIIVLSEGEQSNLEYVIFDYLTNPKHGYWSVSGAVTFYESPVRLNYVTVSNNSCEDALNIVRTTFEMKNCTISNAQSDAFDGDFITGTISSSKFNNLGNDAIDVSGSDIKITNVQISNAGDKGVSAGEDSKMEITNVEISNSEIAVAGKDLSIINVENIKIENTKLAFTAFQKKPEFGPSQIVVKKIEMGGVETKYLIESTSSLLVNGKRIETAQNVKDRMYGVEFGISSDETRKSQ